MSIIKMSSKETKRLEAVMKVARREWGYRRASQELGMSKRQLIRLVKRYRQGGVVETLHRSRGQRSPKKIPDTTRRKIKNLICNHYDDFGPTLIVEQLEERHGIKSSREWIRRLMIEEGIWKVKKQKELKLHQRRQRREQEGELGQLDGSYEYWFEERGPKCCLLVSVDDATTNLQELRFVEHETREGYFALMEAYIKRRGKPKALYTDRHSIFKTTRKYDFYEDTQFARAMKELGIELIHANSPQAKGRVERVNGVLQDRLIKLMRLEGISSIEEGNAYLEKFRKDYNKKFGKKARNPIDAHRKLDCDLEKILCVKEQRKLSKQLSVQFENRCYQINPKGVNARRLIGATVLIYCVRGKVIIELEGKELAYSIYEESRVRDSMDRKELMAFLDKKAPMTVIQRHRRRVAMNF